MNQTKPASPPALRIAMNREGGLFIFLMLAVGGAAVYSSKNGLMLLFCCMFAAFVLFSVVARRNLSVPLVIERRFVEEIFAQKDVRMDVLITNAGNFPVYGLHVYERFEDGRTIGPMYVRQIAPGETAVARYMCRFPTRGNARFCGFQVRSRFPLPFFELRYDIAQLETAYVYPHPENYREPLGVASLDSALEPEVHQRADETIRELAHGRRAGRILWKLSAKRQIWLEAVPKRKRISMHRPVIQIVPRSVLGNEKYERQISQITWLVLDQLQYDKTGVIVVENRHYAYGQTAAQRRELLEMLSTV
ncbi:MAG: hypothetical protein IJ268_00455 [Proteobacteria bacterium]|nr:hypothetical protein [Pseudomonadota bacterium]